MMSNSYPIGETVHWTPARTPDGSALIGTTVRLEPVDPRAHAQPLFEASHGPDIDAKLWRYLPDGPFDSQQAFTTWLEARAASRDPLFYTVIDQATNHPAGMVSYLRITAAHGVIEIGYIWFGPAIQRTRQATEAIFLLARHVFDDLGYRRLEWKCNALNEPSRRAAERFGFSYEGIFRQHMVVKGRNRDTAWYAMLDGEWPPIRAAFEQWLAPDNFDGDGRQRRLLAAIRASLPPAAQA
jgi:RimJ/RimL family protein N-acetyltransferase